MNVPPTLTVPAPVKINLEPEPEEPVMLPETVIVPVATDSVIAAADDPASAMDAADNEPAPTAMVVVLPSSPPVTVVIAPETVREFVPEIVMPLVVLGATKVTDVQLAGASTVTVTAALIVTASPATGTALPPQVAVELQLPVTLAVLAAAHSEGGNSRMLKNAKTVRRVDMRVVLQGFMSVRLRVGGISTSGSVIVKSRNE